ncbi:MAG: DUF6252 family protein [Bacteroidota bacterium]
MMTLRNLFFLLMISMLVVACGNDDDGDDPTSSEQVNGTMTCKVDGTDWTGNFIVQATYSAGSGADVLTITGQQSSDNSQIGLILNPFTGPGTYTVNQGNFTATSQARYSGPNPVTNTFTTIGGLGSLTIVVSEFDADGKVKGTFEFTGVNAASGNADITVTEGSFDIEVSQ